MSELNVTIRQLVTFREVMRSGSISNAADALNRTQPAVSTAIGNLERELGFALFVRENGKLLPTPEANYFREECEAILDRLDHTRQAVARVRGLNQGHLRTACHPAAANRFLPKLLNDFLADKPEVLLTMVMRASPVIEGLVAAQQFDIGFAETPPPRASLKTRDFALECVCLLPRGDPLAAEEVITPSMLDGRPMAALYSEHTTVVQALEAFRAAGARFRKHIELQTALPGLQFVAAGRCYMICDRITAYSHVLMGAEGNGIVVRKFQPAIMSNLSILTPAHATQSLLAREFSELLARKVAEVCALDIG